MRQVNHLDYALIAVTELELAAQAAISKSLPLWPSERLLRPAQRIAVWSHPNKEPRTVRCTGDLFFDTSDDFLVAPDGDALGGPELARAALGGLRQ